jgi:hypothetical protein
MLKNQDHPVYIRAAPPNLVTIPIRRTPYLRLLDPRWTHVGRTLHLLFTSTQENLTSNSRAADELKKKKKKRKREGGDSDVEPGTNASLIFQIIRLFLTLSLARAPKTSKGDATRGPP